MEVLREEIILEESQLKGLNRDECEKAQTYFYIYAYWRKGKGWGELVIDWIWKLDNTTFEGGVVFEVQRSAVIVPLYKGIQERSECKNYI